MIVKVPDFIWTPYVSKGEIPVEVWQVVVTLLIIVVFFTVLVYKIKKWWGEC